MVHAHGARERNAAGCIIGTVNEPLLRVVIAEDSVLLREGLTRLIEDSGAIVVAKVGDGPSLVRGVRRAPAGRVGRGRADAPDPA